jgi:thiol-disulfide isomerase/thioredoxin
MRFYILILFFFVMISCNKKEDIRLTTGTYRAELEVQDNQKLPFLFEVKNDTILTIFNAEERILVDEIVYRKDSIIIQTPVFDGVIKAKLHNNDSLTGFFIKPSVDRVLPFIATKNKQRFITKNKAYENITGNWETVFSPKSESDKYIAKGIFNQTENKVKGTFRTTTGDYRYLEGVVDGDSLKLSTFDGAHSFLFKAKIKNGTMDGVFYSDNHWKEPFIAKKNNAYQLPNEENLTFLKDGYERLEFAFPDTKGRIISLSDKEFDNKIVIVQIMGTWCPNCLDESKFLVNYLKENPNKKIKIIALAFENAKTRIAAYQRINRLKDRVAIDYPVLLAQFGKMADKKLAQQKLPMLNHIISYPTTIFLDQDKKVRKIHTGFNGPATGYKYEEFKKEFEEFIDELQNEKE